MKKIIAKQTKSFWIKLTAIVLAAAIALGAGIFLLATRRETLKIASRTEIIKLWDEQGITRWLADQLHVKVKWIDYGAEAEAIYQRVSQDLGLEPKDLPDIYLGLGLSADRLELLDRQNAFLNFEHMLEGNAPNLQKLINADTDRAAEFRLGGKLISLPAYHEQIGENYPQKAWVNQSWLLEAKMSLPTTPEEFLALLRAFQELNGGAAPLGVAYNNPANMSTLGFLVHAFVSTDYDLGSSNYLNLEGDEIVAGVTQEGYKEALKYLNTIYAEGLVDATLFNQGAEIFMGNARGDERYGVIFAKDLNALFNDAERAADYVPLAPLNNNGQRSTLVRRSEIKLGGFMIPARIDAEKQQLALRFGDAMLDRDGTLTVLYGTREVGWFDAEHSALAMGGEQATWKRAEGSFDGSSYYSSFTGELPYWMNAQLQMSRQAPQIGTSLQTAENWQGYLNRVTMDSYEPIGRGNIKNILPELVPSEEEAAGLQWNSVITYLTEASRDFVTGKADIDSGWEGYVNALDEKGLAEIISVMQGVYNREK